MSHRKGRGRILSILLFLVSAFVLPCTPSVRQGFPGDMFLGVIIQEPLPPGSTVAFNTPDLVVTNIRHNGTNLVFDLFITQTAAPGTYESICRFQMQEIRNATAFTVLQQPTATPTPTLTPVPPTPTPTQPPSTATPTATPPVPTATPTQPLPTATPTLTPPGPTATPTATRTQTPPGATATPTPTPTRTSTPPEATPTRVAVRLRIAPDSIVSGARSMRHVIAGENFGPLTRVMTPSDVFLERTIVLSSTRLEIVVSTAPGTPSGPRVFGVETPGFPPGTVVVTVIPPESLSAPVSVATAAIVHPRPGTLVTPGEQLYARGLLATTGTGPILGSWLFDGVPFDRFDLHATGGEPLTVESKVPVPVSTHGDHFLELRIDQPQLVMSERVLLLAVPRTAASPRLIAPADGAAVREPPLFRWTLVPGAQAYEILFSPDGAFKPDSPAVRVTGGSARLTEQQLRDANRVPRLSDIPMLRFFWSVRPIHPVDVRGKAAQARELMILITPKIVVPPEGSSAELAPEGVRISWRPVARGLVYRVLLFAPRDPSRSVFSALTSRDRYLLRRSLLPEGAERLLFRVEALAPGGVSLGTSEPRRVVLPRIRSPGEIAPAASSAAVVSVAPAGAAPVGSRHPTVAASWEGRAPPEAVALLVDGVDVTPVARLAGGSISYTSLLPLAFGRHEAELRLGEVQTAWTFLVREAAQAPPSRPSLQAAAPAPAAAPEREADWQVDLSGLVSVVSGSEATERDQLHGTFSTTGSFLGETWSFEDTTELALHHELDPERHTTQDSRNWLLRAGGGRNRFRADGIVGYGAPESGDGLQILSTGFTRGGVEARLTTPAGKISAYQTFDDKLGGIFSSDLGEEQRIRFSAWEAPLPSDRFLLRAVYLDARDEGNPEDLIDPSRARAYGAIGRWTISRAFGVTVEGARSEFEPFAEPERSGNSFRLGFQGIVSATRWVVNVFHTGSRFSNPANPSLTSGVQPDRTGGDVGLSRLFGKLTAGIAYRYLESGAASGSRVPDARENSANLTLSLPFSAKVVATASGSWALARADAGAGEVGPIPETDRTQYGGQLVFRETLGRLALAQSFNWSELEDDVSPDNDLATKSAQLTANGNVAPTLLLASSLVFTRRESPLAGRNESLVLMFQPSWTIAPIRLTLAPRASYSRNSSSVTGRAPRTEQYQAQFYWAPIKIGRLEPIVGLAGEWSRSVSGAPGPRPGFDRRYIGTFTIRWGAGAPAAGGSAAAPPAALEFRHFRPTPGIVASRWAPALSGGFGPPGF